MQTSALDALGLTLGALDLVKKEKHLCALIPDVLGAARSFLACRPSSGGDRQVVQKQKPLAIETSTETVEDQVLKVLRSIGRAKGQASG